MSIRSWFIDRQVSRQTHPLQQCSAMRRSPVRIAAVEHRGFRAGTWAWQQLNQGVVARCEVRRRRPREGEQPAGCDQIDGAERSTGKLDAEDREELADVYGDRTDEHGAARIIHSVGRNTGPGTWRSGARRCLSLDQAGERARDAA